MTPVSWAFMGVVWLAVLAINAYSFYVIFTAPTDRGDADEPPAA